MRSYVKGLLLSAALVGLVACGGDDKKSDDSGDGGGGTNGAAAADDSGGGGGGGTYDAGASTGSVSGSVKYGGDAAAAVAGIESVEMASDAYCTEQGDGTYIFDNQIINADGSVPNAFVWAEKGPHKGMDGFTAPTGFVVDQKGCKYVPHTFGVMVGQEFTIQNSDDTMHNVKFEPKRNKGDNIAQQLGDKKVTSFSKPEKGIKFKCDVHSWMSANAFVMPHPFFATTGADGSFEIKGLPAGKYTFNVWHPTYGKGTFEAEVADGAVSADATIQD